MKLLSLIIISFLLLVPTVIAKEGHMKLLTVSGTDENSSTGGTADLYLEIRPGKGTIFIDSFPLTKLDTQISTRFANQIACDFLNMDCSKYDFFYTIRAQASIVGGPSAGAAVAILTITTLSDLKIDETVSITGTINSGGMIGPVAGINSKIEAASKNGLSKVIIPKWQSSFNLTKLREKGVDKKIIVVKVKNLEEALYHFTGKDFSTPTQDISISKDYNDIMNYVSDLLCKRSEEVKTKVEKSNNSKYISAQDYLNRSEDARITSDHYSRASYCFTANLRLRELEFQNKTLEEKQAILNNIILELELFEEEINNRELTSLTNLETYIIVKERLDEAIVNLEKIDYQNISAQSLAYSNERFYSAIVWSEFFNMTSQNIKLDEKHLNEACLKKISEAEERISYAELYLPGLLNGVKEELERAYHYRALDEPELCIFKASKAKAKSNILLTALSIKEEDLENVLMEKFEAIKKIILKQELKQEFPILGYSYYQYAGSLMEHDIISSLTFAEYALELSRLDLYFPKATQGYFESFNFDKEQLKVFGYGFIVGIAVVLLINVFRRKKHHKRHYY